MAQPDSYDVLVLGGGTAGCAMAARLSEDEDRSVCLIEAGPDYGPHDDGRWPEDMLNALALPETHDWNYRDEALSVPGSSAAAPPTTSAP